ncbi:hypothetical protein L523_4489 [Bordetella bronchiseptica MBORD731]|nr:hypothetical protein L523_4489 [Bordetella bronchiseptica MBORD731]
MRCGMADPVLAHEGRPAIMRRAAPACQVSIRGGIEPFIHF